MRKEFNSLKHHINRACSFAFLFQIFGALGAGVINFVNLIFKVNVLGSLSGELMHIFFWATDFCFIGFALLLAYKIAGLTTIAPVLTLGVFFSNFAGQYRGNGASMPMYTSFFTTPENLGGGLNIGYMGYFFMALIVAYIIKGLSIAWDRIKICWGKKLNPTLEKLSKKIKPLVGMSGEAALENLDLVLTILIFPIIAALVAYFFVEYAVAVPFNNLAYALRPVLTAAFEKSNALGGLLAGAMVGFDTIGPLSRAAFAVAAEFAAAGNTVPVTAFALCFAATGWVSFAAWLMTIITKKGGHYSTDDQNIIMSGPINAFFDNMKLTVSFGMTIAYRDPVKYILSYVFGCSLTGLLAGAAGLASTLYAEPQKVAMFLNGELYISFLQPLRSISTTPHGILSPLFVIVGMLAGGALLTLMREITYRRQVKKGTYERVDGDVVLELRNYCKQLNSKRTSAAETVQPEKTKVKK